MKALDPQFATRLDAIATAIQASPEYQKYLDEEEEEDYQAAREKHEEEIAAVYNEVAADHPLQLLAFEQALLDEKFEGFYLPRILGYSVLRGVINENYKYYYPQNHFSDILLAICNSYNFDLIKKRIGQTIQMGFALSSDIWITNFINQFANKKIKYFLQAQKIMKYRNLPDRKIGYHRYQIQFKNDNFFSTVYPENMSQLKTHFPSLKQFMTQRLKKGYNNASFLEPSKNFLERAEFKNSQEHLEMLGLYANFFDLEGEYQTSMTKVLNESRKEMPDFEAEWLSFLLASNEAGIIIDADADNKVSAVLDKSVDDKLTAYYNLTDVIHSKGYVHQDAIDATKIFYSSNEGMSDINQCTRNTIYNYFAQVMNNLTDADYQEWFKLSAIFPTYMNIFDNQKFNQDIKDLCMTYVKKLLKKYVDKRGRDYQDIKKFITTTFLDLGFMTQKQLVELFKTRRKKKPVSS